MRISEENKRIVDEFLNDRQFQKLAEAEIGWPVKVRVDWESGTVQMMGPKSGREIYIQDILSAARRTLN